MGSHRARRSRVPVSRRVFAGVGALALGTSAFIAAGITAQAYGPVNTTLKCWVHDNTTPGDISSVSADWPNGATSVGPPVVVHDNNGMALAVAAGPYTAGTPTSVTLSFTEGPKNGPFAANGEVFKVTYRVHQSSGSDLIVAGVNSAPFNVAANAWGPAGTVTDSITPTVAGSVTISVETINFNATALGLNVTTACNSQTQNVATPGVNPFTTPVTTPVANVIVVGAVSTSASPTPTTSASPTPTTTSASPTPTTTSASPTPSTSSASPTPSTSSASPTPTGTSTSASPSPTDTSTSASPIPTVTTTSPSPTPTNTGTSAAFSCLTLGTASSWSTSFSASQTGTGVNVTFIQGPANGPVGLQAGWLKATGVIKVGAANVNVEATPYGSIPARAAIPGATMTGTVTGTPTSVDVTTIVFKDIGSGSMVDTTCTPTATLTLPIVSAPALPPTVPASNGPLTVDGSSTAGGSLVLSGSGFAPNSGVTAGMYSTPTTLGAATATATGDAQTNVIIPSSASGSHTFVLYGTTASGSVWALTKIVIVTGAPTTTPTVTPTPTPTVTTTDLPTGTNNAPLPRTGASDVGRTIVAAILLLQLGVGLLVVASRRPRYVGVHARRH